MNLTHMFRSLWRRRSYSALVIFTLAVGIGACAAVFTIVDSVLLRPLPFRSPERLALIPTLGKDGSGKIEQYGTSLGDFLDWRERSRTFSNMAAMQPTEVAVTGLGDPEQVEAGFITANLFQTLGVQPFAGRFFFASEEVANSSVVIISHGLWRRRFGASRDVFSSRTMIVDGLARQVVGITPRDFFFAANADVWLPLDTSIPRVPRPPSRNMAIAGRLAEGATIAEASSEMKTIAEQLAREVPANVGWSATALPIREPYVREVRKILYFLFGAVSFLLLMVCVNVANLVLVRNIERRPEFVVRAALGAGRALLWKQTFVENLLLCLCGTTLGLTFSAVALKPMISLSPIVGSSPAGNRILNSVTLDFRVFLFALAVSLVIAVVLSIIPSLYLSGQQLFNALKSDGWRTAGSTQQRRLQKAFVMTQLATSFMLLIGAALMMEHFQRLKQIDAGFRSESLITARLTLPKTRYESHQKRVLFQQQLLEKLRTLPGVVAASTTTRLPLNEFAMTTIFEVDGITNPKEGFVANFRRIGPAYFQTLNTKIVEGREFAPGDHEKAMPVAVVSREMAKRFWPGQSPLGKRIRRLSQSDPTWKTIVGVVEDLKDSSLTAAPGMTFYTPYEQGSIGSFHLVMRTSLDYPQTFANVRGIIRSMDKDLPVYQETTAEELFMDSLSRPRFAAYVLAVFAILGLFVALVGVYGVVSYSTAQRTNEIGIRMAVGAQRSAILRLILEQSARMSLWGILIGAVISLIVERTVPGLWADPAKISIYLSVAILLAFISLFASWIPAIRATRLAPTIALRYE